MHDAASLRPRKTRKARPNKPHTPATGYCFVCGDRIVGRSPRALTCERHKLPAEGGKALVGCPECSAWHVKFTNTRTDVCPDCRADRNVRDAVPVEFQQTLVDAHLYLMRDLGPMPLHHMVTAALNYFIGLDPGIQRPVVEGWQIRHLEQRKTP
jgi:hypothetical protein